ncbi:MAG: hypothetical protein GY715_11520 [Planctomycetes bacterium]|nr:hypothetical protein [Planctomycetota bacterium]
MLAPLVTCLLYGGVVLYHRYGWSSFLVNGALMWIVTTPVYLGAWFWTWKHMEKRYHAALGMRCSRCGYSLRGATGARCPECGETLEDQATDTA